MLFISYILLVAMALHLSRYKISALSIFRIATVILLISLYYFIIANTIYIQSIGSEIGICSSMHFINSVLGTDSLITYLFAPCIILHQEKPRKLTEYEQVYTTDIKEITAFQAPSNNEADSLTPIKSVGIGKNVIYFYLRNESLLVKDGLLNEVFRTLLSEPVFTLFGDTVKAVALYAIEQTEKYNSDGVQGTMIEPYHPLIIVNTNDELSKYTDLAKETNVSDNFRDLNEASEGLLVRVRQVNSPWWGSSEII